jgi:hypothetical protein
MRLPILALAVAALVPAVPAAAASEPQLPPLTVLTNAPGAGKGNIFVTPTSADGKYANGIAILSPDGRKTVWSQTLPAGLSAADFRKQTYHGRPVLTWWQGKGLGGLAVGVDEIYDTDYHKAYRQATADLTSIGGPARQQVIDGVVQEIDIATGAVLFQWDSSDHVPYAQSQQPLPASPDTPWDWFHINAVKVDGDNLLLDSRNTWAAYEISRRDGRTLWQLGGKASSFTPVGEELNTAGALVAWQHDPEPLGNGYYSFFDNESAGVANTGSGAVSEYANSRVVVVKLDPARHKATLVRTDNQPAGLLATSQGNAQPEPGGQTFVGWGALPYLSEFDRHGAVVFGAKFPAGVNTYRAYRFDWR